jgi:1-acyl-sn-glycerol-3-phosphate acyltransferase
VGTADDFLARHPELLDEDRFSPRARRRVAALMAPIAWLSRLRVRGFDAIPPGKCLLVANHSSALMVDIPFVIRAWVHAQGDRPARGLAHRCNWQAPMKWLALLQRVGAVYAHPTVARRVLDRGDALLTFPGGESEALRPFSRRYHIDLQGRTGFVRLARAAGAPIVPVVTCGAHAPFIVLPGGQALARWTGLARALGWKAFPLTLQLVAGLALGVGAALSPLLAPWWPLAPVLAILPIPSRVELEALPPIVVRDDETDDQAYERVRAAMQAAMERMAATRRTPWG